MKVFMIMMAEKINLGPDNCFNSASYHCGWWYLCLFQHGTGNVPRHTGGWGQRRRVMAWRLTGRDRGEHHSAHRGSRC